MTQALTVVKGSIQDVTKTGNTALSILDAKLLVICDRSGSMEQHDAMNGKSRYEVEDEIVSNLQKKYPGQIVLIAFGDTAILCLDGNLPYPNSGSTMMTYAFKLAERFTTLGMKAVLITDGEATEDERAVLDAAKPFIGKLDTVLIGPDYAPGKKFLEKLAKYTKGTYNHNDLKTNPKLLEKTLETLLLKAGS